MGEFKSPSEKQSAKAAPAKKSQENSNVGEADLLDTRSITFQLGKIQEAAQDGGRRSDISSLQTKSSNHTGTSRIAQLQRMSDERTASKQSALTQKNANKTGIPDGLKAGMESVSGISLNDVTVHRNSNKPAQLQAHAYAQGTDIHLGPGQEKHLPHEAWHVVQQKQGRVQATTQGKGNVPINDNPSLEREATQMGQKALKESNSGSSTLKNATVSSNATAQLITKEEERTRVANISQKTARPMTKEVKQTVGNQLRVNEQITGFNQSALRKTAAPTPVAEPKKKEGFDQAGFAESEKKREALDAQKVYPEAFKPSPKVKKAPKVEDNSTDPTIRRDNPTYRKMAAAEGFSSIAKNGAMDQSEYNTHGDVGMKKNIENSVISGAAGASANLSEGYKDAKAKGSGILSKIKEGASGLWSKTKSFFGGGSKEKPSKKENPDEPTTTERLADTGKNMLGHAAIAGGGSFLKATVGKAGDAFANLANTGIAAKDTFQSHRHLNQRKEAVGEEASKNDLQTRFAEGARSRNAKDTLKSGASTAKNAYDIAETIGSGGVNGLIKAGEETIVDAYGNAKGAAKEAAIKSLGGSEENPLVKSKKNLSFGETMDGQSKETAKNLKIYQAEVGGKEKSKEKIDSGKAEEIAAAIKAGVPAEQALANNSKNAFLKEGLSQGVGHKMFSSANDKANQAASLDTLGSGAKESFKNKESLHLASIKDRKEANAHIDAVNDGTDTVKPSDIKARREDANLFKGVGDEMKRKDAEGYEKLRKDADATDNRVPLPSEMINEQQEKLKKKLDKKTGNRFKFW